MDKAEFDEEKVLSKKEQIEIIVTVLHDYNNLLNQLKKIFDGDLDNFNGVFDVGYDIIPAILDLPYYSPISEDIRDAFCDVLWDDMTKQDFFKKISKYLKEEK